MVEKDTAQQQPTVIDITNNLLPRRNIRNKQAQKITNGQIWAHL